MTFEAWIIHLLPVLIGFSHVLLLILLYLIAGKRYKGIEEWLLSSSSFLIGGYLRTQETVLSESVSLSAANSLFIITLLFLSAGYYRFFGKALKYRFYITGFLVHTVLNNFFIYIYPDILIRVLIFNGISLFILGDLLFLLLKAPILFNSIRIFTLIPQIAVITASVVRTLIVLFNQTAPVPDMNTGTLSIVTGLTIALGWQIWAHGLLIADRYRKDDLDKTRKMEELLHQRDRLYAIAAHELNGPVSGMNAVFADLRMNDYRIEGRPPETLELVHRSLIATEDLLRKLLYWIVSGEGNQVFRNETIDVDPVIEEVHSLYQAAAFDKKIQIHVAGSGGLRIYADPYQVGFTLRNAVQNAVRYSPEHSEIFIKTSVSENGMEDIEYCLIEISDNGTGISPDLLGSLLNENDQSFTELAGDKGIGMGLRLCRDIMKRNDGIFQIHSKEGAGTTVAFGFPLAG